MILKKLYAPVTGFTSVLLFSFQIILIALIVYHFGWNSNQPIQTVIITILQLAIALINYVFTKNEKYQMKTNLIVMGF
jgi:ABC-type cobalt transport system substrate-binding protein